MTTVMQKLIDTATPYWDAEAEIARRFYKTARPADHAFYLRAQLWKELNPVDGFFNGLHRELTKAVGDFPKVGKTIDRHDYLFLLEQLVSEYNHFVMLADIFEHVQKRKLTKRDLKQLPQEKKLGDIRRGYVTAGGAIGKAAVGWTSLQQWWIYDYPKIELRLDGRRECVSQFVASNIPFYAGAFRMAPGADMQDGLLNLVTFRGSGRFAKRGWVDSYNFPYLGLAAFSKVERGNTIKACWHLE